MNVRLRPITSDDFSTIVRWSEDREFCLAIDWSVDLSRAQVEEWWTRILSDPGDDFLRLGVERGGQLVGYVDLAQQDRQVGRAEFGIAIGERRLWAQGLGIEAGQLMLHHGFHHLGLTRVTAQVHRPNVRSLALMRRLGFREEGLLRRHALYQGGVCDVVIFGLLQNEFDADRCK
ncbi:GNAT family N-acetyltransferase [Deinococcus peraridilitoris]|uniref:Acetyltransferase, ribosomal protein N-acetylase n=1 Tax=Deinococcus peraridilitoris (strain DSM 19664 / LMG 22246 / CIP 109416 / KR-200) TaxID=937777 RepID=L0A652_DEIPD|nr:GNAT family protein [Deinococcus peraridilitoris]AFZ68627.1 acetyltransferase, ribosomal protein N-acetylase [Deinococcus peraridilitoris DSM 19664]